jgi:hypothetical protein
LRIPAGFRKICSVFVTAALKTIFYKPQKLRNLIIFETRRRESTSFKKENPYLLRRPLKVKEFI